MHGVSTGRPRAVSKDFPYFTIEYSLKNEGVKYLWN
jgi:hypothetical protein